MFNFSGSLLAGQYDCQKERKPPSRPVPVAFPSLTPPKPSLPDPPSDWSRRPRRPPSALSAHFLGLKKPSDVSLKSLQLLNVSFEAQCDFETLLSTLPNDAQSYLPPKSWLDPPDQTTTPPASAGPVHLLSNGRRAPDRTEFWVRAKELFFKNEDAFSALTRTATGGQAPPRLAHFRKFWEGLDNMAYYWDDSLDEYFQSVPKDVGSNEVSSSSPAMANGNSQDETKTGDAAGSIASGDNAKSTSPDAEEPRKKAKTEAVSDETVAQSVNAMGISSGNAPKPTTSISSSKVLPARTAPPKLPGPPNAESDSESAHLTNESYRGYRIGNGAEMPDQYRLDCVRTFLEPIAWAFGVIFAPHRRPPVLLLEHVRFPVRMNSVAWRGPQDRMKARQGWMEGPILGVQCRPDIGFGSTGNLEAESVLDVVRELGGMLLLAQERAREGKTEKRGGEGKWWTTVNRWGGGPGGEVGEATGASDAPKEETPSQRSEEKLSSRLRLGSKDRKRPSPVEVWKTLRPGHPLWDPKVTYEAIGKSRDTEWDDIFMVSSLNHHISVIKLHVHPLYIQYLTDGKLPETTPLDADWCSPKLQRTRWYDLFDVNDRTEAMRGIWGVMAYLLRAPQKGKERDVTRP